MRLKGPIAFALIGCLAAEGSLAAGRTSHIEVLAAALIAPTKGIEGDFTGAVQVQPFLSIPTASKLAGAIVTFQPGARSNWHTHPLGQTLLVTAGTGYVQEWGGPLLEITTGDVVRIPAGVKHWHGAMPHASMSQIAVQGSRGDRDTRWMERVSDAQYQPRSAPPPQ